jgi:hypothetical protein
MGLESVSYTASGNIAPMRFVAMVSGTDYKVFQSTASDNPLGISQMALQTYDSSYAATDGHSIRVYGPGEVGLLELGGTVSAGDYVAPDANGKGVAASLTATARDDIGGFALRSGLSGEFVPVQVVKFSAVMAN